MNIEHQTYIIGSGAQSTVADSAAASAAAVHAGISLIQEHPYMVDKVGKPMMVALVPWLPEDLDWSSRIFELAVPAMLEALSPLTMTKRSLPVYLGLPETATWPSQNLVEEFEYRLKTDDRTADMDLNLRVCSRGHSAGLLAMEAAVREIRNGREDLVLVGGADSYINAAILEQLDNAGKLKSEENLFGFPPGEGAAFCLVASDAAARQLGIKAACRVAAATSSMEQSCIDTDTVCVGHGLTAAIGAAVEELDLPSQKVDFSICDINGCPYRTEEYMFALLRTQNAFVDAHKYIAPFDCWGDVRAASGPLFVVLALAAAKRGYARGSRALLWTSSSGGDRCATLLKLAGSYRQ